MRLAGYVQAQRATYVLEQLCEVAPLNSGVERLLVLGQGRVTVGVEVKLSVSVRRSEIVCARTELFRVWASSRAARRPDTRACRR